MYVAVKGGEKAIDNAHALLAKDRRGDLNTPELSIAQIKGQMALAVNRVMSEGALYDPDLAALALKQAQGDVVEAIFLLRAYRTTLPRIGYSEPIETKTMQARRRISATFKDIPGGQLLGPTYDYTHRLLDFSLAADGDQTELQSGNLHCLQKPNEITTDLSELPRVTEILNQEGLIESSPSSCNPDKDHVGDLTREPLEHPSRRDIRLQNLSRADEGFVLALAYSSQRGFGTTHPFAGEIRMGDVEIEFTPEELGFPIVIGQITVSECEMITQFTGSKSQPPQFTRGYGLTFGYNERKAMAMSVVDRSLRADEFDEPRTYPAQDEEFVLGHSDNVEASGFLQHLKLPHYVDFQGELVNVRGLRAKIKQDAPNQDDQEANTP